MKPISRGSTIRIWHRLGAAALAVAAFCSAAAQSRPVQLSTLRTLTRARDVHNLPLEEAVRGYQVHLHAVVTYYDPYIDKRHGALFVCDRSGCVFVAVPLGPMLPIQAGDTVDIVGVTGPGDYASVVMAGHVQFAGRSHLPRNPPLISLTRLLTGVFDSQWVEIEGRVRNVRLTRHHAILEIASEGGSFTAITPRQPDSRYSTLTDSLVRLRATVAPLFNQSRQMVGVHAFFPSLRELTVIQAAPRDPYSAPAVPISQLFRFSPVAALLHRVHVWGEVTLNWPGRILCIQGRKDGICMQTTQAGGVAVGSMVDVVGFPAISQLKPTLEDASFQPTGQSSAPAISVVAPGDALQNNLDGRLVQIDAKLIGEDPVADVPTLILRSGKTLFSAILPKGALRAASPWEEGSTLRLTGVCSVQVDPLSTSLGEGSVRAESVHLLLRSAGDIAVLRTPSWWTPRHALEGLAAVLLVIVAAFAWIVVLRHRVDMQTRALRASEERLRHLSEHDILTGLPNRLLMDDRLHEALERADRFRTCLGLLMVDLDGFKDVNDAFGHHVGDAVLRELAARLSASVRATDTVARMGGDEFIVLLPDLHLPAEAEKIAAKIVAAVASPILIDRIQVAVTVSVGVMTYPQQGSDEESLLRCADEAMYSAKQMGKNRFQVYQPKFA